MNMPAACPRCGYDQSGAIAAWNREDSLACPLHGICSECGLTFRWHDIIHADRLIVRGFVEHAQGFWQRWRWAWVTWAWTLWPPVFWRKVRMEHDPRVKWCVLWLAILILPVHALVAGAANVDALLRFQHQRNYINSVFRSRPPAQSIPPQMEIPWLELIAPWLAPVLRVQPARQPSWGSPLSLGWRVTVTDLDGCPAFAPACATMSCMLATMVFVLPATRKRARVRASHVWRAVVYGWAWAIFPVLAWDLSRAADTYYGINALLMTTRPGTPGIPGATLAQALAVPYRSLSEHPIVWTGAILAWIVVWWRQAILEMFRGHAARPVLRTAILAGVLATLSVLLNTHAFVNWLIGLPGAEFLFPPR